MRATLRVKIAFLIILGLFMVSFSSSGKDQLVGNYKIVKTDMVIATAYNSLEGQTDSTPWTTASGTRCREGVIAANHLPIGTKVLIDGYGDRVFTVEDRMNARYKKRIDIWFGSYDDAMKFGKRKITYHVLESV